MDWNQFSRYISIKSTIFMDIGLSFCHQSMKQAIFMDWSQTLCPFYQALRL